MCVFLCESDLNSLCFYTLSNVFQHTSPACRLLQLIFSGGRFFHRRGCLYGLTLVDFLKCKPSMVTCVALKSRKQGTSHSRHKNTQTHRLTDFTGTATGETNTASHPVCGTHTHIRRQPLCHSKPQNTIY